MVVHFNPRTQKAEAGVSLCVPGQPSLQRETVLRNKNNKKKEKEKILPEFFYFIYVRNWKTLCKSMTFMKNLVETFLISFHEDSGTNQINYPQIIILKFPYHY